MVGRGRGCERGPGGKGGRRRGKGGEGGNGVICEVVRE